MRSNPFSILEKQQYISLTTYRKNGQAVLTPVWFAQVDHKLFVMTDKNSGKAKRIRNNPCVSVAPSNYKGTVKGPAVPGSVRVLSSDETKAAIDALNKKYGWQKRLLDLAAALRRKEDTSIYLEIIPA